MDNTFKHLLEVEAKAQSIVDTALQQREQIIAQAQREADGAEQHFENRIPDIHAVFTKKAQERANQAISEMQRRAQERCDQLRSEAEQTQAVAVNTVFDFFIEQISRHVR